MPDAASTDEPASTGRPCCRAAVLAAVAGTLTALAQTLAAPADAGLWLFATLPLLCVGWLAPGLVLVPFCAPRAAAPERLLLATGLSYAVHLASAFATSALCTAPTPSWAVHLLPLAVVAAAGARLWTRPPADVRRRDADDGRFFRVLAALFVAACAVFGGALFSDLSSDGIESFEMGRSLAAHALPRSPGGSGLVGLGVGMIAQAYPAYWFHLSFPDQDVAPRLPFLLFLPLVFAAVVALAERGRDRRLGVPALAAAAATTLAFGLTLGLNASFDPYHADLASPGALDAQTAVLLLGLADACATGGLGRLLLFAPLAHFARPTGFLFVLLFGLATPLLFPRGERRGAALRAAFAAALCVALTFLYERVYVPAATGGEAGLGATSLASRLRFLTYTDVSRFAYLLVPTGLVGALALFAFRRHDRLALTLAVVAVATFGLFYVQASYSPHHFVPAMVLPVVVLHRVLLGLDPAGARRFAFVALAGGLGGVVAALPAGGLGPARPYRDVGTKILWQAPELRENLPQSLAAADALGALLVPCHATDDPTSTFMGSTLSLARYARRGATVDAATEFVVRPFADAPPDGFVRLDATDGWALYGRTPDAATRVRARGADVAWRSPLFEIDRRVLFRFRVEDEGLFDLDLKAALGR